MSVVMCFVLGLIIGGLIGFFTLAALSINQEKKYIEKEQRALERFAIKEGKIL